MIPHANPGRGAARSKERNAVLPKTSLREKDRLLPITRE